MGLFSKRPNSDNLTAAVIQGVITGDGSLATATAQFAESVDPGQAVIFLYNLTRQVAPALRSAPEIGAREIAAATGDDRARAAIIEVGEPLLVTCAEVQDFGKPVARHFHRTGDTALQKEVALELAKATGRTLKSIGITPQFG